MILTNVSARRDDVAKNATKNIIVLRGERATSVSSWRNNMLPVRIIRLGAGLKKKKKTESESNASAADYTTTRRASPSRQLTPPSEQSSCFSSTPSTGPPPLVSSPFEIRPSSFWIFHSRVTRKFRGKTFLFGRWRVRTVRSPRTVVGQIWIYFVFLFI